MTDRARRIQRLRRRVAVGAVATFTAAFGTIAAGGTPSATSAATATTTAATTSDDAAVDTTVTQTAQAPSAVTTQQS